LAVRGERQSFVEVEAGGLHVMCTITCLNGRGSTLPFGQRLAVGGSIGSTDDGVLRVMHTCRGGEDGSRVLGEAVSQFWAVGAHGQNCAELCPSQ